MSTLAIWCRVVQSRDVSLHNFNGLAMSGRAFSVALIKIVGTDIARLDNARPYSKGGHRETCISVRADAHYKFMAYCREYYMSCSLVLCF